MALDPCRWTPPAQLDQQPPRRHTTPFISAHWFPNGLETTVVFRLEVTAQGQLGRVAYQPADTDPRIVKSIMRSLERWKFKPGMRQGQPVTSCFEQPYQLVFPRQETTSHAHHEHRTAVRAQAQFQRSVLENPKIHSLRWCSTLPTARIANVRRECLQLEAASHRRRRRPQPGVKTLRQKD
jgi:hypothetical protein